MADANKILWEFFNPHEKPNNVGTLCYLFIFIVCISCACCMMNSASVTNYQTTISIEEKYNERERKKQARMEKETQLYP